MSNQLKRLSKAIIFVLIAPLMQLVATAPQSHAWTLPKVATLQFGGTGVDAGSDSAVDSAGNIFTVGIFSATVDFDSSDAIFNLTSVGGYDGFITKNDKNGNFLWAKQFGGSGNESANSVAIDASSNVVIGGAISAGSNIRIAGQTELNFTSTDAILLKLDSNGNFLWRNIYSSSGAEGIRDVAIDSTTGQIYTIGTTNAPSGSPAATFGKLTNFKAQIGTADIFVNKVSTLGIAIWTGSFGSYAQDEGNSIAFAEDTIGGDDKVYIVGAIGNSITGGAFKSDSKNSTSWITSTDMPYTGVGASATLVGYALQLDATSGDFGWSKTFGSTVSTHKTSLRTVAYNSADGGSIWVGGSFNGSTTWTNTGSTSTRTSTNDAVTIYNSLVAKITSAGVSQSVWNAQSCGPNQVNGISITGDHEIVVTGNFQSVSSLADCIFEPTTIPGSGKVIKTNGVIADGYIFKMSETLVATSPSPLWALGPASINWIKTFGNNAAGSENGSNVTVDSSGMLYLTGTFGAPQLVLDSTLNPVGQLTNKGTIDGFVWKLSPLGGSAISVPDAPTAITATLNGTTASVAFTPPANSGGSPITSYTVTAYNESGVAISPAITVTGASSPISVPNLVSASGDGNIYKFKVKATNAIGTGAETAFSNTVAVKTPSAPDAPTSVVATYVGTSTNPLYRVSFAPPTNAGSAPITSYTATLYIGGVATAFKVSGSGSPITFSQPAGATAPSGSNPYTFVVTATNSVGTSTPSSASNAITSTTATSMVLPSAPRIDSVTIAPGSNTATIALTEPSSVGNLTFTDYRVVALINGVASGIEGTVSKSATVTLGGLTTGVTYTFIAYAINSEPGGSLEGVSPPSNESLPVTAQPLPVPGAPTALSGTTSLTPVLTWTAPSTGGAVATYTVTLTPLNDGAAVTCSPVATATTCTVSTPASPEGKIYSVSVVANNASGSGPATTTTINFPTSPSAPVITGNTSHMKSTTGVLTWTAPGNGGSALTDYRIWAYYSDVAGTKQEFLITDETVTSFTMTSLHQGSVSYGPADATDIKYFTIAAKNAVGWGPESASVQMIPGQPGIVRVQQEGKLSITVKGDPSTFLGTPEKLRIYAFATKPDVETAASTTENTPSHTSYCDAYAPSWTCTVSGLANTTQYWFLARGVNQMGYSATGGLDPNTGCTTSCLSRGTTQDPPPLAPTNVQASLIEGSGTSVSVSWTASAEATSYTVVAISSDGTKTNCYVGTTTSTTATCAGLTPGTTYTFAVYAVKSGATPPNSSFSAVTPALLVGNKLAAPTINSVTKSGENYSVAFTAGSSSEAASLSSYTFTATSSTGEVQNVTVSAPVSSPYSFVGLPATSSWTFTMTANNASGASLPSNVKAVPGLSVEAQSLSVSQGTAAFTFPVKYFGSGPLENLSPGTENPEWIDPTCNIPGNYSTSTAVGTYTITCSGGNGGIYTLSYATATLTVTASAPQMPTGVSASLSGTSASVSFTPGANSSGATYTVVVYANGVLSTITATGSSSPITVTGLTPGVVYSFGVKATNSVGTSATSTLTSNARLLQKVFVIPNAQTVSQGTSLVSFTNLYQTTAFDASTSVSPSFGNTGFTAPSCNTSPSYSSSTAAGTYDITCSGGDGGSLYTFDFSYTNTLLVTANTSMPAAPTNLAVTSSTSSSASISFTPPTVPVSPVVTTYTVTATPIGGGSPITRTITAPASTATVSGLSSSTTYKFQIVANSSGGSSLPATASLTTSASSGGGGGGGGGVAAVTTPSAPSQVTALAVTSTGANSAIVSFVPAAGTSAGTTYRVTAFANGVATQITASGSSSPITISGLTPGTAYTFKVTATNSAGTSSASAASVTIVIPASTTPNPETGESTNNSTVGKSASLQVYFDSNASFVNAKPRRDIKAFVAEMLKRGGPFRIEVVGMVEPTRIQPIPVAQLSKARANSVARLLKAAGLKGKYEIKGGGLSSFRGPKSRYTQIVVTWTR